MKISLIPGKKYGLGLVENGWRVFKTLPAFFCKCTDAGIGENRINGDRVLDLDEYIPPHM